MGKSKYLEMPWSMEDTIENLKELKEALQKRCILINLNGRGERDAEEAAFDLNRAIKALEKQIPKKPLVKKDKYTDLIEHYYCPCCGRYFGQRGIHNVILFQQEKYCQGDDCGQKIDWNEEAEQALARMEDGND